MLTTWPCPQNDYRPIDPAKTKKVVHAHSHSESKPDKRFDPRQPPLNNYYQRRLAALTVKAKQTDARHLSNKQARFLLAELRAKKERQCFNGNALPGISNPIKT